jgi:PIN domain nuclease of toxin-antitoxin system
MRILLDTVTFLLAALGSERLSESARQALVDPDNDVFLSAVSSWEIAVKHALGRLELPTHPERFVPNVRERMAVAELALDEVAALGVGRLPDLHRDPFDRMLVCQAISHGMVILTPDEQVRQYPVRTVW